MKPVAIVVLILVAAVIVGHAVLGPGAPTVEQASNALAKTERELPGRPRHVGLGKVEPQDKDPQHDEPRERTR